MVDFMNSPWKCHIPAKLAIMSGFVTLNLPVRHPFGDSPAHSLLRQIDAAVAAFAFLMDSRRPGPGASFQPA